MEEGGTIKEQKAKLKSDSVLLGGLAYLFGVYCFGLNWTWYLGLFLALSGVAFFVFNQKRDRKEKVILIAIVFCMFFVGMLYYSLRINISKQNNNFKVNEAFIFQGLVSSEPKFSEKSQQFSLKLQNPERGWVSVITGLIPEFKYGDKLEVEGKIEEQFSTGIVQKYSVVFPKINFLDHQNSLRSYLIQFKLSLISNIKKYFPRDEASLLSGLTLGARSDFSSTLKDQMMQSGTTHIVALSGYNIAIFILIINGVLISLVSRKKLIWLIGSIVLFFVIMVGGEASIVRAAIMASILLLARYTGRKNTVFNAVVLTAVLMVFYNPTILNFDLGFQLSFLSLLGIIYLAPPIKNLLEKRKRLSSNKEENTWNWKENLATTVAAQLAVTPIIIQSFNQFSFGSVIANILILSTVPLTMLLGFAVAIFGSLFYALGFVLAKITSILLVYQIFVIKIFSHTSINIGDGLVGGIFIVLYYLVLILIARRKIKSNSSSVN